MSEKFNFNNTDVRPELLLPYTFSDIFTQEKNRGQLYHLENPTCPDRNNADEKIVGYHKKLGSNISESSMFLKRPGLLLMSSVAY